jgi:hypothetical protein
MAIVSVKSNKKDGTVTLVIKGNVVITSDVYCRDTTTFVIDSESYRRLARGAPEQSVEAIRISPKAGKPCAWMAANFSSAKAIQ